MWYVVPGLARKLYLPDWINFKIMLIPASHTMQRPGFKLWSKHPKWIAHETGNYRPGATPLAQYNYVFNGAPDQYGNPQEVSFTFTGDDDTVIMIIPADEVTWQSACGGCAGNYDCWSYEQCVNPETDKAKARIVHAYVAAGMLEAADTKPTPENVTIHYDWNNVYGDPNDPRRHHCPNDMLNDGYVDDFERDVAVKWTEARKQRDLVEQPPIVVPPKPTYPAVHLPDWWDSNEMNKWPADQRFEGATAYVVQRNLRCIADKGTSPLTYPSSITAGAKVAGARILKDEKKHIIRVWVSPVDGKTYALTHDGFWILASKFTPRIRIDPR